MLCKSPYMIGPLPCACGRCMPCRVNKKRNWTFRLELEAQKHTENCVVTLTYNDLNLSEGGNHDPVHAQKWLRKLRKILAPKKIRYFLVGEYGKKYHRPHYHAILFGLSPDVAGGPITINGRIGGLVKETWPYGNILVDKCDAKGIAYVAGYVTKKLTSEERESRGVIPEFTRMSLRPGIGAAATKDIARGLASDAGLRYIAESGDVPHALLRAGKIVPIGRYLRGLLREKLGIGVADSLGKNRNPPSQKSRLYWQEMWALRRRASQDKKNATSFKEYLVDMNAQKIKNLEARVKLHDNTTF